MTCWTLNPTPTSPKQIPRTYDQNDRGLDWSKTASEFRRLRTTQLWGAATDHPVEATVARVVRAELGTEKLIERVQMEIADHHGERSRAASNRLAVAVLLLTIASVVIPVAAHFSKEGQWDAGYVLALVVSAGVVMTALWALLRRAS